MNFFLVFPVARYALNESRYNTDKCSLLRDFLIDLTLSGPSDIRGNDTLTILTRQIGAPDKRNGWSNKSRYTVPRLTTFE